MTRLVIPIAVLFGVTFIYPNAGGWTTITPGAPGGGIHQYMVTPPAGQDPYAAWRYQNRQYAPTYQVPSYQPSLPDYEDDDDGE